MRKEHLERSNSKFLIAIILLALVAWLGLAGCGEKESKQYGTVSYVEEEPAALPEEEPAPSYPPPSSSQTISPAPSPEPPSASDGGNLDSIPTGVPKIAYVYTYGFRLSGKKVPQLQRKHIKLCNEQGPRVCQILGLSQTQRNEEGDQNGGNEDKGYALGELRLSVASTQAVAFGEKLRQTAQGVGSEQVETTIQSEELSDRLIDSEARLKTRIELRDRLSEVLRSQSGTVSELIQAERSVADVNTEIEKTRASIQEMNERVAYSRVNINYFSTTPVESDFFGPVNRTFSSLDSIWGVLASILIIIIAIGVPIGGLFWFGRRIYKRFFSTHGDNIDEPETTITDTENQTGTG